MLNKCKKEINEKERIKKEKNVSFVLHIKHSSV